MNIRVTDVATVMEKLASQLDALREENGALKSRLMQYEQRAQYEKIASDSGMVPRESLERTVTDWQQRNISPKVAEEAVKLASDRRAFSLGDVETTIPAGGDSLNAFMAAVLGEE